jgi:peptidyl-prolyl cis-trans isomerase C/foldase protein PrsA
MAGCGNNNGAVATVNGKEITKKEYDQRYNIVKASYESEQGTTIDEKKDAELVTKLQNLAYDDLVVQKLLDEQANKQGVKITDKEIDENVDYIKNNKNQTDKQGFEKFLKQMGVNEKELRQIIKEELIYRKMGEKVSTGVTVTEKEARDYYDKNKSSFEQQAGIQMYHILTADEKTAQEVMQKLKAGEDWNKLANEYSIDTSNKAQGGDLGVVNESTNFVEEFKSAALKLQPGEITQTPVKTQFGYHIIKAGEKKPASITPFEDMKNLIQAQLEQDKKSQNFNKYIEGLKDTADIKDLRNKK